MAKETAVQWMARVFGIEIDYKTEIAEQMEKEQIMNAYIDGEHQQGFEGEAEQYYNEIYQLNQDKTDKSTI